MNSAAKNHELVDVGARVLASAAAAAGSLGYFSERRTEPSCTSSVQCNIVV